MDEPRKDKPATPLVEPLDEAENDRAPGPVDTRAPVSTDKDGETVELPDLGGVID